MNEYTHTVVIAIGRNTLAPVDGDDYRPETLPLKEWLQFQGEVGKAIEYYGGYVVQRPATTPKRSMDQIGQWGGETEPAATFIALMPNRLNVAKLGDELAQIKTRYGQSVIGYITAPDTALYV